MIFSFRKVELLLKKVLKIVIRMNVFIFLQVVVSSSYHPEQLKVFVFKRMSLEAGCVLDTINGSVVRQYFLD